MSRFLQALGYRSLSSPIHHLRTMASSASKAQIIDGTAIAKCVSVLHRELHSLTSICPIPQIYP